MSELHPTKVAVLRVLDERQGSIVGYGNLASAIDRAKSTAKKHAEVLDDRGLISVHPDPDGAIIQLTGDGRDHLAEGGARVPRGANADPTPGPDAGDTGKSGGERGANAKPERQRTAPARAHYVTARCPLQNSDALPDEWRGRWLEHRQLSTERAASSDAYVIVEDGVRFRVHRESVVIVLKESVTRSEVREAMDTMMDLVMDAAEWIRAQLPDPVTISLKRLEIGTTHIALVDHYLAGYVRDREDLELSEIVAEDWETGEQRVILDESDGVETEPIHPETAEDDARFLEEQLEWQLHNKDTARRLRDVPGRVDELERSMRRTSQLLEQLVELKTAEALDGSEPPADAGPGSSGPERGGSDDGVVPEQPVPAVQATSDNIERGLPNNGGVSEAHRREVRQARSRIGTDGLWNDDTGGPDGAA